MFSTARIVLNKNSLRFPVRCFSKGLFAFSNIKEPHDCILFANTKIKELKEIRSQFLSSTTKKQRAYYIDQISNTLDYSINLMNFLQYSHDNPKFCQAANTAAVILMNAITEFNNDREIYETLCSTMTMKSQGSMQEEDDVLISFIKEYEHDGIAQPMDKEIFEIQSKLTNTSYQFQTNIRNNKQTYPLKNSDLFYGLRGDHYQYISFLKH